MAAGTAVADELSIAPSRTKGVEVEVALRPGGKWIGRNFSVRLLIETAYGLNPGQLAGGPPWMDSARFDVELKQSDEEDLPKEDAVRSMLQTLLADQFRLAFHRREMELPVFLMTQGQQGEGSPSLHQSESQKKILEVKRGHIRGTGVPMTMLADRLSGLAGCPVLDRTGLQGDYDFEVAWTEADQAWIKALHSGLGLKLDPSRGPVELFVIDRLVERPQ